MGLAALTGGFLVVLFRGGAWGVGVHADVDPRVCAYGLRLGVGRGFAAAAVVGHALHVGCHRGPVGGRGRCWWTLERSVGLGCRLWEVVGRGASQSQDWPSPTQTQFYCTENGENTMHVKLQKFLIH